MTEWVKKEWGNAFTNPSTVGSTGKLLIYDAHRVQQTNSVKTMLE
jgi:hypothetical protein